MTEITSAASSPATADPRPAGIDAAAASPTAGTSPSSGARIGTAAALILAIAVAYLPAFSAEFVYDDLRLVHANPNVRSLGAALRAFFEPLWAFEDPMGSFQNAFWRPLTVLTLAIGRALSGLEPGGYHSLSIALHALATLVAWRLAARLTRSEVLGGAAGLFFGLHPVHVESVAWISAVNDPLHGLFALLAVSAHLRWRERGSRGFAWAGAAWLLAALLAKEQALAVPLIVLVLDLALGHLRAREGEDPFELLGRAYGAMLATLGLYYAGRVVAYDGNLLAGFDQVAAGFGLELSRAIGFRLEILGSFLALLFVPIEQAVFRMVRAELPDGYAAWPRALLTTGLWTGACIWAGFARSRRSLALLLAIPASFALLLVRFESAGGFPISDRYLYVPVVFAGALLAWVLSRRLSAENAATAVGVLALAFGAKTFLYARQFQNEERFFRAAVAASPDLPYVRWGLGRVLLGKYRALRQRELLDEAVFHFAMGLKLGDDYGEYEERMADELAPERPFMERARALTALIYGTPVEGRPPDPTVTWTLNDRLQSNMGMGWCTLELAQISDQGDYDWPKVIFEGCVKLAPGDPRPLLGLGTVLMQMGRLEEAEKQLAEAVRLNRAFAEGWHNLAECLRRQRRWDDARQAYEEALVMRPGNLGDLIGVVESSIEATRFDLAARRLDEARELFPDSIDLVYLRGVLTAARGDLSAGLAIFDEVLARQADYPMAHYHRGMILMRRDDVEGAARSLSQACALMPDDFKSHNNMASLLLARGESAAARPYLQRAYELSPPDDSRQVLHFALAAEVGPDAEVLAALAEMDYGRRDIVHALDFAERALAVAFDDYATPRERFTRLNYLRGRLYWALDQHADASEAYQHCLRTAAKPFQALHDLAVLHAYDLGQLDQAREWARQALEHIDEAEGFPPDQLEAMRGVLTAIAEHEPEMGPMPAPEGADEVEKGDEGGD